MSDIECDNCYGIFSPCSYDWEMYGRCPCCGADGARDEEDDE